MISHLRTAFILLSITILSTHFANAQNAFDYDTSKHAEHLGIYIMPFVNANNIFVSGNGSAIGRNTLGFEAGAQYQYHISKRLFIRGAVAVGFANYGYKYHNKYTAKSDTTYPKFADEYAKVNNTVPYLKPQVLIGREFVIKSHFFVEVAAGASILNYLKKADTTRAGTNSSTTIKGVGLTEFYTYDSTYYGFRDKWGVINAELNIGYHTRGFSDFFDRCGIGFSVSYSFNTDNGGYSDIIFYNKTYNYNSGMQKMMHGQASIGLKLSYNLF